VKLVLVVHNSAIDNEVNDALTALGMDAYTKLPGALGRGHTSEPHLDTDVWPGTNTLTLVVLADDQVPPLLDRVRELRAVLGTEGIKAFVLPVEALT
jgi:hypothetical protein